MQKTLLITWWLWYIWSHGVIEFVKAGYEIVIIDNLSNSKLSVLDNIQKIINYKPIFYQIDLLDKDWLEEVFIKHKFDGVVHFAGLKAVGESCENVWLYHTNNIVWSINLFETMEKYSVRKIIFSSSATVYKVKDKIDSWLKEIDPTWDTTNPYGTTKFAIEQLLKDYANHKSWQVVNLRYFNPIWAHESWFLWEDPNGIPNNLLPYIMKVAVWELSEVWVFGNDYKTIDWTGVRDYIDVVDLVVWHLKAWELVERWMEQQTRAYKQKNIETKPGLCGFFESFNLWVWKWVSVLEMIDIASDVVWNKIPYTIKPRRDWDLDIVYSDPSKANEVLNWKAQSSIRQSIENSWKFYNK